MGTRYRPSDMELRTMTGDAVLAHADALRVVYRAAFAEPPWHEDGTQADAFLRRLAGDVRRPGFVAVVAADDGRVAGFGTAWPTPRPFPAGRAYDRVRRALPDVDLTGRLEVDELAVAPYARGRGLGGRLLAALTAHAPSGGSWLLTAPGAAGAIALYERLGWRRRTPPDADVVVYTHR
jgi:ribosomal protein S18 acetylase RimI-like enzyme